MKVDRTNTWKESNFGKYGPISTFLSQLIIFGIENSIAMVYLDNRYHKNLKIFQVNSLWTFVSENRVKGN